LDNKHKAKGPPMKFTVTVYLVPVLFILSTKFNYIQFNHNLGKTKREKISNIETVKKMEKHVRHEVIDI